MVNLGNFANKIKGDVKKVAQFPAKEIVAGAKKVGTKIAKGAANLMNKQDQFNQSMDKPAYDRYKKAQGQKEWEKGRQQYMDQLNKKAKQ